MVCMSVAKNWGIKFNLVAVDETPSFEIDKPLEIINIELYDLSCWYFQAIFFYWLWHDEVIQ